jgi:hypothetical protein
MWSDSPADCVVKLLLVVSISPSSFVDSEKGLVDGWSDDPPQCMNLVAVSNDQVQSRRKRLVLIHLIYHLNTDMLYGT